MGRPAPKPPPRPPAPSPQATAARRTQACSWRLTAQELAHGGWRAGLLVAQEPVRGGQRARLLEGAHEVERVAKHEALDGSVMGIYSTEGGAPRQEASQKAA